jgi:hypothetical protein
VAVKVIEHDSRMSSAVENEVQLMLNCKHPNVVAAYHYVTHKHQQVGQDRRTLLLIIPSPGGGVSHIATSRSPQERHRSPGHEPTATNCCCLQEVAYERGNPARRRGCHHAVPINIRCWSALMFRHPLLLLRPPPSRSGGCPPGTQLPSGFIRACRGVCCFGSLSTLLW